MNDVAATILSFIILVGSRYFWRNCKGHNIFVFAIVFGVIVSVIFRSSFAVLLIYYNTV